MSAPPRSCTAGSSELSTLEALPSEVVEEVVQQLGPADASRVRAVSKKLRTCVDGVAWRSLRLTPRSVHQIRLAAELFTRRMRLAARADVTVFVSAQTAPELLRPVFGSSIISSEDVPEVSEAVASFLSACASSSGGLGGLCLHGFDFMLEQDVERFAAVALDAIGASEPGAASCSTLRSLSIGSAKAVSCRVMAKGILKRLVRFSRLEALAVEVLGCPDPPDTAALAAALPSLRAMGLRFPHGASVTLAAFAAHPTLEEMVIGTPLSSNPAAAHGFDAFAAGPAARRLRRLSVCFGARTGFDLAELPSLARLASLERLELVLVCSPWTDNELSPDAYAEALGSLQCLRELTFRSTSLAPAHVRGLARALAALRARSLVALQLHFEVRDGPDARAAFGELLRAAGPALAELVCLSGPVLQRDALAACPRLRRLNPGMRPDRDAPPPPAEAVEALTACPRLESILDFYVRVGDEREATEGLEPLRRLAEACPLGAGAGCSFRLQLRGEEWARLLSLAEGRIRSVFPESTLSAAVSIPFDSEQEGLSTVAIERLRGLAALGESFRCSFALEPGAGLQGAQREAAVRAMKERVRSVLPNALVEVPLGWPSAGPSAPFSNSACIWVPPWA